jgi:hypothetical protein
MIYSIILKPPPSQLMQSFLFKSRQNVVCLRKISTISTQPSSSSSSMSNRRRVEHSFLPNLNSILNSNFLFTSGNNQNPSVAYFRYLTTTTTNRQMDKDEKNSKQNEQGEDSSSSKTKKPPSKFKQFYSQYGPMFLVVHLTTVVMWIYGFFLISKQ